MSDTPDVVTKGEFAALTNVSPGRVSQWISEGKLTGAALVGEGRSARIHVPTACAQLRLKLDLGQRFGNGLETRIDAPPALMPAAAPPSDPIEAQFKREKLREIEFRNRDAAEREMARRGTYVTARDASDQMAGLVAAMLNVFEGGVSDLATAVAARFEIPQRDVLHLLRGEVRNIRARATAAARKRAEGLPIEVVDEIEASPSEPEVSAPAMN